MQRDYGLVSELQIIMPKIECGQTLSFSYKEGGDAESTTRLVSFDTVTWGNGGYTLDLCRNLGSNASGLAVFYDTDRLQVEGTTALAPYLCTASVTLPLSPSQTYGILTQQGVDSVTLTCHVDGELACGDAVAGSTLGAMDLRGGSAGERVFSFSGPENMVVSFDTCGSQLNATLGMYRYTGDVSPGEPLRLRGSEGSCGDRAGLSMEMAHTAEQADYRLVVEGVGSTEGEFFLRMTCRYPEIRCGDTVRGSIREEDSGRYPKIYTFSSGRGGTFTFDTCNSSFDTDLELYEGTNLSTLVASQDYCMGAGPPCLCGSGRYQANLTKSLRANVGYALVVKGHRAEFGDFTVRMSCGP